jgi:hypothetical protein
MYKIERGVQIIVFDIMEASIISGGKIITLHILKFVNYDKVIFICILMLKQ